MNRRETIRAWRDPVFRAQLSSDALEKMPEHPAGGNDDPETDGAERLGIVSVSDACMLTFTGGCTSAGCSVWPCPQPKPPRTCDAICTKNQVCEGSVSLVDLDLEMA